MKIKQTRATLGRGMRASLILCYKTAVRARTHAHTYSSTSFETSEPVSAMATPMSERLRAGESFTPSPVTLTMCPRACFYRVGEGAEGWKRARRCTSRMSKDSERARTLIVFTAWDNGPLDEDNE